MGKRDIAKPSTMSLEDEGRAFYEALGEAIAQWASVEVKLYVIFQGCNSPNRHQTAAAAYYAVDNFRAKLRMVDAVVRLLFSKHPAFTDWENLTKDINSKAHKRNELAHYEVSIDPTKKSGKRYILRPAVANPLGPTVFNTNQGLHVNELRTRRNVFDKLATDIGNFHSRFGEGHIYYVPREGFVSTKGVVMENP